MALSLRAAAALLDPADPPRSLRGVYARQPWVPVDPATGIPPIPASGITILGAITTRQPLANDRLAQLAAGLSGVLVDFSSPDAAASRSPGAERAVLEHEELPPVQNGNRLREHGDLGRCGSNAPY